MELDKEKYLAGRQDITSQDGELVEQERGQAEKIKNSRTADMREKSRSGGGWRYLNQTQKKDLRGICLGVGAEGSGQINNDSMEIRT